MVKMITAPEQSTEEKILSSATAIFVREGYAGARMQAIADHAGINKALLHYYFRSKENLFERIFKDKYQMFLPKLQGLLDENLPFVPMIERVVDAYIDMLTANPYLPALMISTLSHHPEFIEKVPRNIPVELMQRFENEVKAGKIKAINPTQFFISLFSLCLGPYAAKPMMSHMMGIDDKAYQYLLEQRRSFIKDIVRAILTP